MGRDAEQEKELYMCGIRRVKGEEKEGRKRKCNADEHVMM